jgi:hypothetical protein
MLKGIFEIDRGRVVSAIECWGHAVEEGVQGAVGDSIEPLASFTGVVTNTVAGPCKTIEAIQSCEEVRQVLCKPRDAIADLLESGTKMQIFALLNHDLSISFLTP